MKALQKRGIGRRVWDRSVTCIPLYESCTVKSNYCMPQSKDTQTKSRNHPMLVHFEVVTMLQDADSGSASQKDLVQSLGRKVGSEGDVHSR